MAVTYETIATQTLSSAASTVTFSSIASTYKDLILISNITTATSAYSRIRVGNGSVDTNSNYSWTYLFGSGSGSASGRSANETFLQFIYTNSTAPAAHITQFMNYSNTSTQKIILSRTANTINGVEADVGLWRSTSAINTISLIQSSGDFAIGSTFTLYGIKAA